jgi:hypothetical protein
MKKLAVLLFLWLFCGVLLDVELSASVELETFKASPFYSDPISKIKLSEFSVNADNTNNIPVFKKEGKKKYSLSLNTEQFKYYESLCEEEKKILIKISSLGIYNTKIDDKLQASYLPEQYSLIYKKDSSFNLETIAIIPMTYEGALPIISDYNSYNDWVLKDINKRRDGEKGGYFLDINSLRYFKIKNKDKNKEYFATVVSLNTFFSGRYNMNLLISDETDKRPVPSFRLKMEKPSKLAKEVEGVFSFIVLPGFPYFVTCFTGHSKLNWTFYRLLPLRLVKSQVVERIYTLLENIQYKAEREKQKIKKQKIEKPIS